MSQKDKIYAGIKRNLENEIWPSGARLPSLARLADQFKVSRSTAWMAVRRLRDEGLVTVRHRGSIIAGRNQTHSIAPAKPDFSRGTAKDRLQTRLGRDLVGGAYHNRPLPSVAKLAARYGAAPVTVYKALNGLVSQNLLAREGRKYRQHTDAANRRALQKIVFITHADESGRFDAAEFRTLTLIQTIEREAGRMGFDGICMGFNSRRAQSLLEISRQLKNLSHVSGFIINFWNPWDSIAWQRWCDLFAYLAKSGLPVIVVDQTGETEFPALLLRNPLVRILRISSYAAGARVAEALRNRGHGTIVYVTSQMHQPWAQARYKGLSDCFLRYNGGDAGVTLFAQDLPVNNYELMISLLRLDKEKFHALHYLQYTEERIKDLCKYLASAKSISLYKDNADKRLLRTLSPMIDLLVKLAKLEPDPRLLESIQGLVGMTASDRGQALWLYPLFEKVLAESSASAWVCSSDQVALAALAFLGDKKRDVPGEISVVGFDNWREAYEKQLSTFDFNMTGIMQEALLMVFDRKSFKARATISEVEGYVVERSTTRR